MIFLVTYSTTESVLKLIGLLILCFVIIAASFYTTKFIGSKQQGAYVGSNFESIDVFRLTPNKYLQLIRIADKYFVIAVCKDSITLITQVDEAEIKFRSNGDKKSFKDIFTMALNKDKSSEKE